jgi:hypothetical protein
MAKYRKLTFQESKVADFHAQLRRDVRGGKTRRGWLLYKERKSEGAQPGQIGGCE